MFEIYFIVLILTNVLATGIAFRGNQQICKIAEFEYTRRNVVTKKTKFGAH